MKPVSILRLLLLVVSLCEVTTTALFAQWVVPDLKSSANRFDYVIVAPPAYVPVMQSLATWRVNHNGFAVGIALTDSIYSSFGEGTSPDTAIKNFMIYALSKWSTPAPKYFLFAGNVNAVPSHKEPGFSFVGEDSLFVDRWFVEEWGDSIWGGPLLAALGRLPAWDSAGLSVMTSKIPAYESAKGEEWMNRSIAVADSQAAPLFSNMVQNLNQVLADAWPDSLSVSVDPSSPLYLSRAQFRGLWNGGAAIISLIGQMNWYEFSHSAYFTTWDVDSLATGSPLPLCILLAGQRFEKSDTPAIAVKLLQSTGKGAIACVSPSGAIFAIMNSYFLQDFATNLAGKSGRTLGEAFVSAINDSSLFDFSTRRQTLLGDPALVVKSLVLASVSSKATTAPGQYHLFQNYPNPFNPSTTIEFALPQRSHVTLSVYNTLGQLVTTLLSGEEEAGYHGVKFDGTGLASGVYFYRLQAGSFVKTMKMMTLK